MDDRFKLEIDMESKEKNTKENIGRSFEVICTEWIYEISMNDIGFKT